MDPELFLDVANHVKELHMFPYFDIASYAVACMHVRDDMTTSVQLISRKHPLACWLSSMLSCFAGYIVANCLLGEPLITPFKSMDNVLLASIVWYLIFYSPFDMVYQLCKLLPVKATLGCMKEVQRVHKVYDGVHHAAKLYPTAYLVQVLVGVAKGAGAGFTKIVERFIRGTFVATGHEFLQPTFPTKACLAAAALFVVEMKTDWISAPHSFLYFGVVIFFVYFKLASVLLHIHDPFLPLENLFCAVFMGGLSDALGRAVQATREKASAAKKVVATNGELDKKKLL